MNNAAHDFESARGGRDPGMVSVTCEGAEDLKKMDSPFLLRVSPEIFAEWEGAFPLRKK